ncbi:acyl-CoA desaturase [Alterisphingorhabdus coralli]|uniref:Acyl-CoA desaturase n=1 Tax=Alterisphingorhabdus coralli TaxID=3071408 RepID=A0AA97F6H6_9SPHN|nr:acyl-CoA desaturase [Parasphingorhabdus sp. SCSIO 66989]WOE75299.1 acyl-CoA desaturase [Parasphingorhabdus sp. SCSIO 66989]
MGRDLQTGSPAFKVNSLTGLDQADPGKGTVHWDAPRSIWNMGFLIGSLILGPLYFTWPAFLVFLILSGATLCVGHSVGFHRRLIHRSFECPKWLERTMVYFGTLVGMGGPIWTIGLHDMRDWAQREEDCHWFLRHGKPIVQEGFYYLNFKLKLTNPPGFDPGKEIAEDPFYRFLQKTWMLHQLPIAAILYLIGGLPFVVWGVVVRVSACIMMHWCISYFAHSRGPQDWHLDDAALQAHNVPILAIPTMGESWHCNHHAFPRSAAHGLYPGQIDLGFQFIRLLEKLGLAWDIKLPENLPPRPGISPVTDRALSIAAPGQAELCKTLGPNPAE